MGVVKVSPYGGFETDERNIAGFNFTNGIFEIRLANGDRMDMIAHELKHAYQFEIGAYSIGPRLNHSSYPNLLYDLDDEVEAYNRGALFGGEKRSAASLARDPEYQDLKPGPICFRNIPEIYNYRTDSALQGFANRSKHAFRINGVTYYKQR